jgi:hypothetical protein
MGRLSLVLLLFTLLLAACASRATMHDADFADAPYDVTVDWELTKERCSQCHTPDYVFDDMHLYESREALEFLVEEMSMMRGSRIERHEIPRITSALDWHRKNH